MTLEKVNIVAIVDAYSSGNLLALEFKARGYDCVHVQSSPHIPALLVSSFKLNDFTANIIYHGCLEQALSQLRETSPLAVLAGSETGVALADALSEALGLKSNGTKLSSCRRNKYDMAEQIRSQSLKAVRQLKASSLQSVMQWLKQNQVNWPVVVKPLHSAASDGVFLCQNESELQQTFRLQCGEVNKLDLRNDELLVQEFLLGPEYIVDTVSCRGIHSITDIWRSVKISAPQGNGSSFLYDYQALLPAQAQETAVLRNYIFQVLNALGIQYGPAHAEVILTKEGPVLVEVGARLAGTHIPVLVAECTGQSPVELTVDAYCDEQKFFNRAEQSYTIKKQGRILYLQINKSGCLKAFPYLKQIKNLSSYHQLRMKVSIGEMVSKTSDLYTIAGILELANEDEATLNSDLAWVKSIQDIGMLEIE